MKLSDRKKNRPKHIIIPKSLNELELFLSFQKFVEKEIQTSE